MVPWGQRDRFCARGVVLAHKTIILNRVVNVHKAPCLPLVFEQTADVFGAQCSRIVSVTSRRQRRLYTSLQRSRRRPNVANQGCRSSWCLNGRCHSCSQSWSRGHGRGRKRKRKRKRKRTRRKRWRRRTPRYRSEDGARAGRWATRGGGLRLTLRRRRGNYLVAPKHRIVGRLEVAHRPYSRPSPAIGVTRKHSVELQSLHGEEG